MNIHEFGRVDFVEEVKEREIKKYNNHRVNNSDRKCSEIRSDIEDYKIAKESHITVEELNQYRMVR